jgi:DNA polymerase-3 subunit beta
MKIRIDRLDLVRALEDVKRVVARKNIKPILDHCRMRVRPDGITLAATNFTTWILSTAEAGADVQAERTLLFPAHDTLAFLKACEGVSVVMHEIDEVPFVAPIPSKPATETEPAVEYVPGVSGSPQRLRIVTSDAEEITLDCGLVEEYPVLNEMDGNRESCGLQAVELTTMLEAVMHASAADPGRYAMNCVRLELDGKDGLRAVATDGRRLAMYGPSGTATGASTALVPYDAALDLTKLLPKKGEMALVEVDVVPPSAKGKESEADEKVRRARDAKGYYASFYSDRLTVHTRLLDGEFPRYGSIIPLGADNKVRVQVKDALRRIKTISVATTAEARCVTFGYDSDGNVLLRAKTHGKSAACKITDAAVLLTNGTPEFGVNPSYLADALASSGADDVEIGWNKKSEPLLMRAGKWTEVLMPITLDT